jgi:hypothetical protein
MVELYSDKEISEIKEKLSKIHPSLAENLEFEYLIYYPFVIENLKKKGIQIKRSR